VVIGLAMPAFTRYRREQAGQRPEVPEVPEQVAGGPA